MNQHFRYEFVIPGFTTPYGHDSCYKCAQSMIGFNLPADTTIKDNQPNQPHDYCSDCENPQ